MGRKDAATKKLLLDTRIFADVFNYCLYNGQQIIKPEELRQIDTNLIGELNKDKIWQLQRDVLMEWLGIKDGKTYIRAILGVENQTHIDYGMPFRISRYDTYSRSEEYDKIKARNTNNKNSDFTSVFKKNDKLKPIITVVVYYGETPWLEPKSLNEITDTDDPIILENLQDYKIKVIDLKHLPEEELRKLNSELQIVAKSLKYSDNKVELKKLFNDPKQNKLSKNTAVAIQTLTNIKYEFKTDEEGMVDMSLAIRQIQEDARNEGIHIGEERGEERGILIGEERGILIGEERGMKTGIERGMKTGALSMLFKLVKQDLLSISQASENAELTEEQFKTLMTEAGY